MDTLSLEPLAEKYAHEFISERTRYNGYWIFFLLANGKPAQLGIDLLHGTHDAHYAEKCDMFITLTRYAHELFVRMCTEEGIQPESIAEAKLTIQLTDRNDVPYTKNGVNGTGQSVNCVVYIRSKKQIIASVKREMIVDIIDKTTKAQVVSQRVALYHRCVEEFHHLFHSNESWATRLQNISVLLALLGLFIMIIIEIIKFVVGLFV